MKTTADKDTDHIYGEVRSQYADARANGYRFHSYFLREQEIIVSKLSNKEGNILDIGCGSGLMAKPLHHNNRFVVGIDYNMTACMTAKINSLEIVRGNAFVLPFSDASIDNTYCCQFLNQQSQENVKVLLSEILRVLTPQGEAILIWRNGDALIHKIAHTLFTYHDKLTGKSSFPVINHPMSSIITSATSLGFEIITKKCVFPIIRWHSENITSLASTLIGASYFLVLKRP